MERGNEARRRRTRAVARPVACPARTASRAAASCVGRASVLTLYRAAGLPGRRRDRRLRRARAGAGRGRPTTSREREHRQALRGAIEALQARLARRLATSSPKLIRMLERASGLKDLRFDHDPPGGGREVQSLLDRQRPHRRLVQLGAGAARHRDDAAAAAVRRADRARAFRLCRARDVAAQSPRASCSRAASRQVHTLELRGLRAPACRTSAELFERARRGAGRRAGEAMWWRLPSSISTASTT